MRAGLLFDFTQPFSFTFATRLAASSFPPFLSSLPFPFPFPRTVIAVFSAWLGKQVRVTISDGRVVLGELLAIDSRGNLVLGATERVRLGDGAWACPWSRVVRPNEGSRAAPALLTCPCAAAAEPESGLDRMNRFMGMTVVPADHLRCFEVSTA